MATGSQSGAIVAPTSKSEVVEALQRAIDRNYRRLIEVARADWERLFCGKDPSDACVSVHIHSAANATEKRAQPGSGFLSQSKVASPKGKMRERFA